MKNDKIPETKKDLEALRFSGKPLFFLGQVVATPAALKLLESQQLNPATYLRFHQNGAWGQLEASDRDSNDAAVLSGGRILSAYSIKGSERIYVITEAVNDGGGRASTCLLLPSEY